MGVKSIQASRPTVIQRARLAVTNRMVAWAGVIGVGLMPCPDCGLPLGVKIWPAAGVVWLFQRFRRRKAAELDLLLMEDVAHSPAPKQH
jgi:hypothetical protein